MPSPRYARYTRIFVFLLIEKRLNDIDACNEFMAFFQLFPSRSVYYAIPISALQALLYLLLPSLLFFSCYPCFSLFLLSVHQNGLFTLSKAGLTCILPYICSIAYCLIYMVRLNYFQCIGHLDGLIKLGLIILGHAALPISPLSSCTRISSF